MVYFALVLLIILLDQYTKSLAIRNLEVDEVKPSGLPFLKWWHKKNYGIAYSKFNKYPELIKTLSVFTIAVGLLYFLFTLPAKGLRAFKTGFALALGGAIGNLIDRVRNNCVTDFIYIKGRNAPIFNLADLFIAIGSLVIILVTIRRKD